MAENRRPGGRRQNAEDGEREHRVVIKLDDDEYVQISALSEAMGVSRPRVYTRAVESGGQVFDRVALAQQRAQLVESKMLLRLLAGVATNLNQLAHRANIEPGDVTDAELRATLAEVRELVAKVTALVAEGEV